MTRTLENLFERYRSQGDLSALGEVFDRTADELFRIGVHLSRDPLASEDLLQETFLAAIERNDQYEEGRPLVPWLVGILSNMARRRWRDGARQPDPARITWTDTSDTEVPQGEVEEQVLRAVERLQSPYREVVHLHLRFDMKPAEIAHLIDREPGTVRTQLQRGLEKLRARLPVSLAGSVVPAMRGLGSIREAILAKAGGSATVQAATTSGPSLLHLMLAVKKMGTVALLLLPFLAVGAVLWSGFGDGPTEDEVELRELAEAGFEPPVTRTSEEIVGSDPTRGTSPTSGDERPMPSGSPNVAAAPVPAVPSTPAAPPAPARAPVTTPDAPPITTAPDLGTGGKPWIGGPSFEDWTFWYHNNKADIENLKWALYHKTVVGQPALRRRTATRPASARGETRWTEKKVEEIVIPALLWAMDTKNSGHQDTESASYIALAKVARDPVHIPRIMSGLDLDREARP